MRNSLPYLAVFLFACSSGGGGYHYYGDLGVGDGSTGGDGFRTFDFGGAKLDFGDPALDFGGGASCFDGIKNGSETDVDCGGGGCVPCADGLGCLQSTDCQSRSCVGNRCQAAASCNDGIRNGAETDVDCGGGNCPACADYAMCKVSNDCSSFNCSTGLCCAAGLHNCGGNCVDETSDINNCGQCGHACIANTQTCSKGACVAINNGLCKGVAGGAIAKAMGAKLDGFCWYLSTAGSTCDAVCAAAGGSNQANAALNALANDCNGGGVGQPATWFYQNGNAGGWSGPTGSPTGYTTLGHGYSGSTYYGKCMGGSMGSGTLPGDVSDNNTRSVVCACSQ